MNFDERLEKLGSGVDALTESVELISSLHRDNEKRMAQMMDAITRLAHIADIHDHRIEDLENRG
jgi:Na+/phosphate symporter